MSLESWIRERLPQTFHAEWPVSNRELCTDLDHVIEGAGMLVRHRLRAQGTTSIMLAAALYAVSEKFTPCALLLFRSRGHAETLKSTLEGMAGEAGLWEYIAPPRRKALGLPDVRKNYLHLAQGGIIGCHSVHENLRGMRMNVDGEVVRPRLALMDLGTRPHSLVETRRLQEGVQQAKRLNSHLTSCGVAEVYTFE